MALGHVSEDLLDEIFRSFWAATLVSDGIALLVQDALATTLIHGRHQGIGDAQDEFLEGDWDPFDDCHSVQGCEVGGINGGGACRWTGCSDDDTCCC